MFSNAGYFDQGQTAEWCGELIDTSHATIRDLSARFDLPLDDLLAAQPTRSKETYFFAGRYYPKAQADVDFKALHQILNEDLRLAGYPTTVFQSTPQGRLLNRMSIYGALRVPEVWRWDGETLSVHLLTSRGTYRVSKRSKALPFLPLDEFRSFLMRNDLSETQLIRAFRTWVREHRDQWMK